MNYKLLNEILIENDSDINEIKNMFKLTDDELFKIFLSTYKQLTPHLDKLDENQKKIIKKITYYLPVLANNSKDIDHKLSLAYIKKILNKINRILIYKKNDKFYLDLQKKLMDLQELLLYGKYNENNENNENNNSNDNNNNKYEFLIQVINEIRDTNIVSNILNKYPYYINLRSSNNIHIIINIFEEFEKCINNNLPINQILYYEKILEIFLDNDRIKLDNDDIDKIEQIINNIRSIIDINYSVKNSKYKQLNSCIEILKMKSIESNISQKNLRYLEEKYEIDTGFSTDVINELNIILNNYKNDINPIITIDGKDTTCFDDACQIRKIGNTYELKIFIADIASQIPLNSKLDIEASKKFANIYLPNSTITMLPVEISNNVFSLNNNYKKRVIEYKILINSDGDILEYSIDSKIIHIDNNLSYATVNQIIEGKKNVDYNLESTLLLLSELAQILRSKNKDKESYRITSDIVKSLDGRNLDKNQYQNRTKSEIIIEELMILTNYLSAYMCLKKGYPYIYRINEKMENTCLYNKLIELSKQKNIEDISKVLNGYAKSKYSAIASKHEGLNLSVYSHSTSPLRRYPDIVNQRILNDLIINKHEYMIDFWIKYLEENVDYYNDSERRNNEFLVNSIGVKRLIKKLDNYI